MSIPWGAIILAVLQFINGILKGSQDGKLIDAGYQKAIAEQAALILKRNIYAKEVMASINALDANGVDKLLQDLEPKPPG